ncbi:Fc.00g045130.m01.CDS01 [Cosmosporella sp. VM-42]
MQQPKPWALLSAIYAFTLAAAGSLPRGVGPEFTSFYESKDEFSCITNAAIKLSLSQINDNTCDCPDGSDEPGTAACANIDPLSPEQPLPGSLSGTTNTTNALPGFWCANEGHIGMYVPFLYVNDGVCDYDLCCDGSEEFKGVGGVKCENRCKEIGKEYRRLETEKRENMEKAGKKRKTMAKEAKELRRQVEAKITSLRDEIKGLEAKKNELETKRREVEQQEKGKVVKGEGSGGGKLGILLGLAKTRVNELRDTLDNVITQRDDLRDKVGELEAILKKFSEEYNPNFNDEGVKSAVKSFEDYAARQETDGERRKDISDTDILSVLSEDSETNGINWKEFEEGDGDDTDVLYNFEAYLPPFLRSIIHKQLQSLRVWLIENGMLADTFAAGTESHLLKAAREAVEANERDLKSKNKALENENADLEKDYGPSDIFRALKGKCVSMDAGEYTYEHCWLDRTSQKSKKGHGNSNMGNFKRIDREIADDEERLDGKSLGKGERMVLRYEDGQQCWNGPKRRTDVWLGCAETEEVWRVSESEKCVYKMEVGTPAACEVEDVIQEPRSKDEL